MLVKIKPEINITKISFRNLKVKVFYSMHLKLFVEVINL